MNIFQDVIKDLEELTGENEKFKKSTKTNKKKSVIHPEPSNENTLWYKSPSADFVECTLQAYGIPGVR